MIYCDDGGVGLFINNANNSKIYNNIFVDRSATGSGIQILNSSENEIINNTVITHGKGIKEQNSNSTIFNKYVINNNNLGVVNFLLIQIVITMMYGTTFPTIAEWTGPKRCFIRSSVRRYSKRKKY